MKLTWKNPKADRKKRSHAAISYYPNLPFEYQNEDEDRKVSDGGNESRDGELNPEEKENLELSSPDDTKRLANSFQAQGDKLAEEGKFREALGKWETALSLMPENAILHEQKAQVLLEIGDAWAALKAATRATDLNPSWAEAWITLGRAQLNFGEPDSAMESFDRALAIKPDSQEAREDRQAALHLVKKRKQLHLAGLSTSRSRYAVGDKDESS